jgi:hypothetical protein
VWDERNTATYLKLDEIWIPDKLNWVCGAEHGSRGQQLCRYPRISQECLKPKVHYRTHNSPPLVPILGHTKPVHLSTIRLNAIHPPTTSSSYLSPSFPFAHPIHLNLVILIILEKSTNHNAPRYVVFSTLLSLHPSSAPCSQTPSVCVDPLMSETKFRNHTEHGPW